PAPPLRTVHLRRSPSPPDAAPESAAIAVDGGGGVDLALVGRALGLDPASVRLNGYFVSRGPGHVSTAVTWGALLAFFAARGLPTGADPTAPVAVRGRPAPSPPRPGDPGVLQSSKRKSGLETENCSKKSKLQHNSSALSKSSEELLSDEITLGLKRRLRLDDMTPSKRIKQVDYNS
uniref:Uncharacterized protein n=1 Tax=Aegilops tauschii subsp. strangulata TaxID=200361 RepID=A0A453GB81_AEGTS